jgi:pimeloyl-ACP methyl ester carboxylesterase
MTTWSAHTVKSNGISLSYHRTGGDKPPVVLAHGITDSGLGWTRTAQALEDQFDLIMVDARGHGRSDKPDQGYSAADHAADLAGLIEALGLGRPALIGHSMGARSVAALAAGYPHLVRRIVLEDPPWPALDQPPPNRIEHFQNLIAKYRSMRRDEIIAFGRENNPTWDDEELGYWSEGKLVVSPNVIQASDGPPAPWSEVVPKLGCPTLLVTGEPERGGIVSPETAAAIVATNPQVRIAHLAGAGHNIRRDQFTAYVAAVRAFL